MRFSSTRILALYLHNSGLGPCVRSIAVFIFVVIIGSDKPFYKTNILCMGSFKADSNSVFF
jgi:hypothetical protein